MENKIKLGNNIKEQAEKLKAAFANKQKEEKEEKAADSTLDEEEKPKAPRPEENSRYDIIFDHPFDSHKKDVGKREDIQVGDVVTWYSDNGFTSRKVIEIKGLIVVLEHYPGEKRQMIDLKSAYSIRRPKVNAPIISQNTSPKESA